MILLVNIYYPEGFHFTEFQKSFASRWGAENIQIKVTRTLYNMKCQAA